MTYNRNISEGNIILIIYGMQIGRNNLNIKQA